MSAPSFDRGLAQLLTMGFLPSDEVSRVLRDASGNVDKAIAMLVSGAQESLSPAAGDTTLQACSANTLQPPSPTSLLGQTAEKCKKCDKPRLQGSHGGCCAACMSSPEAAQKERSVWWAPARPPLHLHACGRGTHPTHSIHGVTG